MVAELRMIHNDSVVRAQNQRHPNTKMKTYKRSTRSRTTKTANTTQRSRSCIQRAISLCWLIVTKTYKQWCAKSREHYEITHDHTPVLQFHDGKAVLLKRVVRPLLLTIEICGPVQWKPGFFKGQFKDGLAKRIWWLWFAVGWVRMDLYDYNRYIASGATEWRERSNEQALRPARAPEQKGNDGK